MSFSYNKSENESLGAGVLHTLQARILSGELKPGDWLPAERDMAEQMGVSRSSLHQAILELAYQGFVSIIPRRGTVVQDFRKHPTTQALEVLMNYGSVELDHSLFLDMMDTRLWLEAECARRACTNIYPNTLSEMESIVEQMEEPGADITELIYGFHYRLTQASGNSLYAMIFRAFEPVLRTMIKQHYSVKAEDIHISAMLRKELLEHIKTRREEQAAQCVCRIIRQGIDVLEERYEK